MGFKYRRNRASSKYLMWKDTSNLNRPIKNNLQQWPKRIFILTKYVSWIMILAEKNKKKMPRREKENNKADL